jgi:hypothetical protein
MSDITEHNLEYSLTDEPANVPLILPKPIKSNIKNIALGKPPLILRKSINKIAKGYRKEKRCSDELKAEGYITWKTIRHKFLNIDIFGLFDVVALHPQGLHIRFIQVKSNKVDSLTRDNIKALKMPKFCIKEIWVFKDNQGWVKDIIN